MGSAGMAIDPGEQERRQADRVSDYGGIDRKGTLVRIREELLLPVRLLRPDSCLGRIGDEGSDLGDRWVQGLGGERG